MALGLSRKSAVAGAVLERDISIPIPDESVPTITITGTDLDGYYGCNSGGGTVACDIGGDEFTVANLPRTEMGCSGERSAIEGTVAEVLTNAMRFEASARALLTSDGAEVPSTLEFEPYWPTSGRWD